MWKVWWLLLSDRAFKQVLRTGPMKTCAATESNPSPCRIEHTNIFSWKMILISWSQHAVESWELRIDLEAFLIKPPIVYYGMLHFSFSLSLSLLIFTWISSVLLLLLLLFRKIFVSPLVGGRADYSFFRVNERPAASGTGDIVRTHILNKHQRDFFSSFLFSTPLHRQTIKGFKQIFK